MLASLFSAKAQPQLIQTFHPDPAQLDAIIQQLNGSSPASASSVPHTRQLAEVVAWADQNDAHAVLDRFWERGGLSVLLRLAVAPDACVEVQIQVLQTCSILVQCLRSQTALFQLLSQNHVNALIAHEFALGEEELLAHYISFIKTVALRLNATTMHFFFDPHTRTFPLYTRAVALFSAKEGMVRAAVKSILLLVFRLADAEVQAFCNSRTEDFHAIARCVC
jgi:protein CLEC16A